jgi:hypothetical protein
VRRPEGGDSGEWVTQLERSSAPAAETHARLLEMVRQVGAPPARPIP